MITKITTVQSKRINKLIPKECCNYKSGNCLLLDDGEDHRCVQQISSTGIYCKYFEKAVLPSHETLYAEIMKGPDTRRCIKCGDDYVAKANNQKYCKTCAKLIRREKAAEYVRKLRS